MPLCIIRILLNLLTSPLKKQNMVATSNPLQNRKYESINNHFEMSSTRKIVNIQSELPGNALICA